MGEMRIMDSSGDLKVIWDPDKEAEVKAAKKQFDDLTKKEKYFAFSVKKNGDKKEKIEEFDPELGMIILCPPLVGG
jgi:hypothetical protein